MKSVVRYNKGSNEKRWKKDGTDEYLIEWKKKKNYHMPDNILASSSDSLAANALKLFV